MHFEPNVNILLVDDHAENLLALEAILGHLEGNLIKAQSGEEALRCLLHQDFAVILLDVQMPGMDGFETATLIRSRQRSRHTPIIFLTAFSTSDTMVFKGYSLGAVDYLLKPIEADILLSKVSVFVELFKKTEEVTHQAAQLEAINTELRQSEERFRLLSACSPVGIFLTNVEGDWTYTNPRCQSILGLSLAESLGEGWRQAIHADQRDRIISDWSHYAQSACEYSAEVELCTADKQVRWIHLRSSPMYSSTGELIGYVGTIEDITERKQAEEVRAQMIHEQVARQQAETANQMKDDFLAVLSHELRTPLNSVLGWARLLRSRKFDEKTTAKALETIERNAQAQTQLIEDILDVSLIMQGKLRLNICPMNLVAVLETAIEGVRPQATAKRISLETDFEPNLVLFWGDPERLQQVAWNLLSNAIKFTPEEGRVETRLSRNGSDVQIQVIDTGIGIDSSFLPKVFDRFRQADSTTTRAHGGLGLGLAIVHYLVGLHGGEVLAESEGEGKGAAFTVRLPLRKRTGEPLQDTADQPPDAAMSEQALQGVRVLVVDDEADARDFLSFVLEQHGAIALTATSAAEALTILQTDQPDILVSDIGMPVEDGYALIRRVRSLTPTQGSRVPAVALTAYVQEEDRLRALSAGFQAHLAKPVEPAQFIATVINLVQTVSVHTGS